MERGRQGPGRGWPSKRVRLRLPVCLCVSVSGCMCGSNCNSDAMVFVWDKGSLAGGLWR